MSEEFVILAARIRSELPEIERLVRRVNDGWQRAAETGDDLYLDGVALNLHGFYNALEKIFERIADATGEGIPEGANWHHGLLQQMSTEVACTRPAVISEPVKVQLDEFRAFRHVARNVYGFNLQPAKLERLVTEAATLTPLMTAELGAFADFRAQADDDPVGDR